TDAAMPRAEAHGSQGFRAPPFRARLFSCEPGDQSSVYRQIQEVGVAMKILILFDIARRLDPGEVLSPAWLKEEQKPTEADVMEALLRRGHSVETLAVFDNVTHIVEKLKTCAPDVVFNL